MHVQISVLNDDTIMMKAVGDLFLNRAGTMIPQPLTELPSDADKPTIGEICEDDDGLIFACPEEITDE